jgi:hypothetical protein
MNASANAVVEAKSGDNSPAPRVQNQFGALAAVAAPNGASANALMARESQDIMVQMMAARNNPRDIIRSVDRILNAFTRPALCEDAMYEYARGGSKISGLSIRAAEVLAQNYGNMRCGVVELSRQNGQSEVLTFAQDLETGFSDEKRFYVKHWRDTKQGGYAVTDERDIYEMVANQGARRKRACILAVIPKDVQDAAEQQINLTMNTKAQVTPESIKNLLESFAKYGVTKEMVEKRIQRHVEAMQPAQLVQLRRIGVSLKDGMSEPDSWFEMEPAAETTGGDKPAATTKTEALKDAIKAKGTKAADDKAKPDAPPTKLSDADKAAQIDNDILAMKEAGSAVDLEAAWKPIRDRWIAAGGIPVDVEAYRNERARALSERL